MLDQVVPVTQLDPEWVELILIAKTMGLTPSEIRQFLQKSIANSPDS